MNYSMQIKMTLSFSLVIFLTACKLATESDDFISPVVVENNQTKLLERVDYSDESIEIVPEPDSAVLQKLKNRQKTIADLQQSLLRKSKDKKISEITLTQVAEIDPPIFNGVSLQAADIRIKGSRHMLSITSEVKNF